MLATTTPSSSATAPGLLASPGGGELKFRIQGGEHDGRMVRVSSSKCTIGSAAGSTLRLRGSDIDPLHCLILSGRNGTLIRCHSPRTYLNGAAFEDAPLQPGDVLRIASVELAVVACPQKAEAAPQVDGPAVPIGAPSPGEIELRAEEMVASIRKEAQEQISRLERERQEAQEQSSRLQRERQEAQEQITRLERERQETQEQSSRLQHEWQEAQEQISRLERERQETHSERGRLAQELAETTDQLRHVREQLEEARRTREQTSAEHSRAAESARDLHTEALWQQRQEKWESQARDTITDLESRLAALEVLHEQHKELARNEALRLQQELAATHEQYDREKAELATNRGRLEADVAALTQQLAQRDAELESARHQDAASRAAALEHNLSEVTARHEAEKGAWLAERSALAAQAGLADETSHRCRRMEEQLAEAQAQLKSASGATARHEAEKGAWLAERSALAAQAGLAEETSLRCRRMEEQLAEAQAQLKSAAEATARHEAEKGAWLTEREQLEAQAAVADETSQRCRLLEQQLTDARAQLELALVVQQESPKLEHEVERWQAEAHKWQLQADELSVQLIDVNQVRATLLGEIAKLQAEVKSSQQTLAERQNPGLFRERLELQQRELAEARAQLQQEQAQVARLVSETASREDALARFESELRQREHAWQASRAEEAAALEERSHLIASQIAEFEAEQTAFGRQQAMIIQQISLLEERVQELTLANESRATNSPVATPRPHNKPDSGATKGAAEPSPSAPAASEPPTSVLSRLMQAGVWKQEVAAGAAPAESSVHEQPPAEKPKYHPPSFLEQAAEMARQEELALAEGSAATESPQTTEAAPATSTDPPPAARHDEDDSIEQYMSRLLNRVRRTGDSPASAAPVTGETQPAAEEAGEASPAASPSAEGEPQEYVRRSQPPEAPERLSLMRELANSAARSAIQTHAQEQHVKREDKRKSLVALLSLIGAAGLAVAAGVTGSLIAAAGSIAFFGVCCFISLRRIQNSLRQMRLSRPGKTPDHPQGEQKAGPPTAQAVGAQPEPTPGEKPTSCSPLTSAKGAL